MRFVAALCWWEFFPDIRKYEDHFSSWNFVKMWNRVRSDFPGRSVMIRMGFQLIHFQRIYTYFHNFPREKSHLFQINEANCLNNHFKKGLPNLVTFFDFVNLRWKKSFHFSFDIKNCSSSFFSYFISTEF
jgi:hypothetical protein